MKIQKLILSTIVVTIISCSSNINTTNAQEKTAYKSNINREDTKEILYELASDELTGRKPNTKGFTLASDYVIKFLENNNIKPLFKEGYKDVVTDGKEVSANIVSIIGEEDKTKPYILIGAHLDHLGKSNDPNDDIYNGANDNASGVTATLLIAKELTQFKFKKNVIIALFTEEESGLIGSKHLAKRLKKEGYNLSYMLNFEMIGKTKSTGTNKVYITGHKKSDLADKMNAYAGRKFVEFLPKAVEYNLFKHSDNYPFYQEFDVPCHTISSFDFDNYPHYHKESDESTLLDVDNMNDIINSSANIIYKMLDENIELTKK